MMKCPSCKYENRRHYIVVDDVVYFKSGKRKGEIKEINKKTLEFYADDPEFVEIGTEQNDNFIGDIDNNTFYMGKSTLDLYACPKCGTVIVKQLNS